MTMPHPASEPTARLDETRLAEFRLRLEEARDYHQERIQAGEDSTDDITAAIAARSRSALVEVEEALLALHAGQYGICASCGEQVSVERLEAVPHTRMCAACARSQPAG